MAKTGKRRRKSGASGQKLLVLVLGTALVLCGLSIAVGVMNWATRANEEFAGGVRLEVLNGTGEEGLGKVVARALMRKKVDVLLVGNADGFDYAQTVLIARKPKPEIEALGQLLGCKRFVEQLRDDGLIDATLIIGADYRRLDLGLDGVSNLSE